jgi:hypothetical protein
MLNDPTWVGNAIVVAAWVTLVLAIVTVALVYQARRLA